MKHLPGFHFTRIIALMLLLITCHLSAYAQGSPYLTMSGTTSACTNGSAGFSATINNLPPTCSAYSYNYNWTAIQDGRVIGSGGGPSFGFVIGSSTSTITVSVSAHGCAGDFDQSTFVNVASSGPP